MHRIEWCIHDVFEYLPDDTQPNMDELLNQILRSDGVVNAFMSDGVLHDMGDFEDTENFGPFAVNKLCNLEK